MSARNLSNFAESAMAVNRVIQQHFSMNYSYMERPAGALRSSKSCHPSPDILEDELPRCVDDCCPPLGLSPPAESQLLRRRLQQPTDKSVQVH